MPGICTRNIELDNTAMEDTLVGQPGVSAISHLLNISGEIRKTVTTECQNQYADI